MPLKMKLFFTTILIMARSALASDSQVLTLVDAGVSGGLGKCTGTCASDSDCRTDLKCFDTPRLKHVPGCAGERHAVDGVPFGFCYDQTSDHQVLTFVDASLTGYMAKCTGKCTTDSDCRFGLKCFNSPWPWMTLVPGCEGKRRAGVGYCYDPSPSDAHEETSETTSANESTSEPTPDPPRWPAIPDSDTLLYIGKDLEVSLGKCEGSCTVNADCREGLLCSEKMDLMVPGCSGIKQNYDVGYCYDPNDVEENPTANKESPSSDTSNFGSHPPISGNGGKDRFGLYDKFSSSHKENGSIDDENPTPKEEDFLPTFRVRGGKDWIAILGSLTNSRKEAIEGNTVEKKSAQEEGDLTQNTVKAEKQGKTLRGNDWIREALQSPESLPTHSVIPKDWASAITSAHRREKVHTFANAARPDMASDDRNSKFVATLSVGILSAFIVVALFALLLYQKKKRLGVLVDPEGREQSTSSFTNAM